MSAMSSLRRGIYGVEPRPKTAKSKFAFYRERDTERGEIRKRAEAGIMRHRAFAKKVIYRLNISRVAF